MTNKAQINAGSAANLEIGGNFNNQSSTYSTSSAKGQSTGTRTGINQLASIYIGDGLKGQTDANGNPLITLNANVAGNTTFDAGIINNQGGSTRINTAGDTNLNALTTGYQTNAIGDSNNYFKQGETRDIGSQITGTDNIIITSGGDFTGKAVSITSDTGTVGLQAGNDITLSEGRHTQNLSTANKTTDKGLLSKTTTQSRFDSQSDTAISNQIEGNNVIIDAGNNVNLTATNAISDQGTLIKAGNDVNILAAQNTASTNSEHSSKKSGVFSSGGLSLTIGKQQNENDNAQTALTHTASNVGAIDGNVSIEAGNHIQQTGSNVIAGMGDRQSVDSSDTERGNVSMTASNIDITDVMDEYTNQNKQSFKQSGLTLSVSNPITDFADTTYKLYDATKDTDSERYRNLAAVAAAADGYMIYSDYKDQKAGDINGKNSHNPLTDVTITATLGTQRSSSERSSYDEQSRASNVTGNNVYINATGSDASTLNVIGSNINSNQNIMLQADDNVNLLSSQSIHDNRSDSKNSGAAVGGYVSIGKNTSYGVTASASSGKGMSEGQGVTQNNTHVNAGNQFTIQSGDDLNLKGAVALADKIEANVGGSLTMQSLQDTYKSESQEKQYGGNIKVGVGTQAVSGNVNANRVTSDSNYQSVNEQTALKAGTQGFTVNVADNTSMTGAVIASDATADKNSLTTTTFESSDITNNSSANVDARGINISSDQMTGSKYMLAKGAISNIYNNTDDSKNDTTYTRTAISEGSLVATDAQSQQRLHTVSNNVDSAHQVATAFDIDDMMKDTQARQFIKNATVETVFKYSDEAHKRMFIEEAPLYKMEKDANGDLVYALVPEEDKASLLRNQEGKVHVFAHGIFNDENGAAKYAVQNRRDENAELGEEPDLDKNPIYFVYFPKTNNALSEMMVAGYQKYLESDTLGLTNASQNIKGLVEEYGGTGMQLDGHSRGTLTITNVYTSLKNDGKEGAYPELRTNMVGPAANVRNADNKLAELQGRDDRGLTEQEKADMSIHYQAHEADPVSGLVGWNSSTGGTTKDGGKWGIVKGAATVISGATTTAHNCYGVGTIECDRKNYWDDGIANNGADLPKWEPAYRYDDQQNKIDGE